MKSPVWMTMLSIYLFLCLFLSLTNGAALISIDFGNEFMKIGVIKSGSPMEIALDPESQRKISTIVAIKDGERFFGTAAENIAAKTPQYAFRFLPSILGKTLKHPVAVQYASWFPHHEMSYENGTIVFKMKDTKFTSEELVSMLIENARDNAEIHIGEKIKSAVITVPSYWSQSERSAMIKAATIVDLDVLQIMNSNSAVALHFGIFRKKTFNATAQYFMFYDIGSQDTCATIASYKYEASEDPELSILGVGCDQTLGTSNFIQLISKHLVENFQSKYKLDPTSNKRSMSKFVKESKRVLKILSANTEVNAQIENAFDGKDFSLKISRTEFEEMNSALFDRLDAPFLKALSEAQISVDTVSQVILMGGGTRIPKIQEKLLQLSQKSSLGKSINSDEAAALGALYQAAHHSPLFKVLKFNIKDFNYLPISSSFKIYDEDTKEKRIIDKTNLLFKTGNPFPQKRALSIIKHVPDIKLKVFYPNEDTEKLFGTSSIMNINIPDYQEKIKAQLDKGAVMKGLKVHFFMDLNGLLSMTGVDAKLEIPVAKVEDKDDSGTLKSISDKISSFFGNEVNNETKPEGDKPNEDSKEKPTAETKVEEKPKNNFTKPIQISETIKFEFNKQFETKYEEAQLTESKKKIELLRTMERNRKRLDKVKNDLESFIFASKENMESKEFIDHSTEEERKKIQEKVDTIYVWYDEQGNDTPVEEFEKNFKELLHVNEPVENRKNQFKELPKSFQNMRETIKLSKDMLRKFNNYKENQNIDTFYPKVNFTLEYPMVTQEKVRELFTAPVEQFFKAFADTEISNFEDLIKTDETWVNETEEKLEKSPKNKDFEITVAQSTELITSLFRQLDSFQEKMSNQIKTLIYEYRKKLRESNEEKVKEAREAAAAAVLAANSTDAIGSTNENVKESEKKETTENEKKETTENEKKETAENEKKDEEKPIENKDAHTEL